jgi:CPA1 family monovalent cation:H+ antiporter
VVLVSLVVQGLTLVPLTRGLGVALDPAEEQGQVALARYRTAQAGLAALETLVGGDADLPAGAVDRVRAELQERADQHRRAAAAAAVAARPDAEPAADGGRAGLAELRRAVLQAERDELLRLRRAGEVEEPVLRRVLHELDLAEAALSARGR